MPVGVVVQPIALLYPVPWNADGGMELVMKGSERASNVAANIALVAGLVWSPVVVLGHPSVAAQ